MKDMEIKGVVREDKIPPSGSAGAVDYEPLYDKFHKISKGSAIHVETSIKSRPESIRKAFERKFGKSKATVTRRKRPKSDITDVYIIRKS